MLHRLLIVIGVLSMFTGFAMAQEEQDHHGEDPQNAVTSYRLLTPSAGDFLTVPDEDGGEDGDGAGKSANKVGINAYVDVNERIKAGVLTPFYRFSPKFAMKAHVPIIWDLSGTYGGEELSTSGLGDVTLDGEYTHALNSPGAVLRFSASVKLPTGDDENTVEDDGGFEWVMPLGTGTTDYVVRGQFAKACPKRGLLIGAMYRKNSPTETSSTLGSVTETIKDTAPNQIVLSAFGRQRVSRSWWLHLGASMLKQGDGERITEYSDGSPEFDWGANRAGTLVDIYPGVSYALGMFNPYLGVRLPVATSYDNDSFDDEREVSFIFQFSYRPESLNR